MLSPAVPKRQILMTFDVQTNWKKLMLPSVDPRLECLNGVRALSMFWIIYGHTFFTALQAGFMNSMYMLPPDGYTSTPHDWAPIH